jgi:hypothetical protein
VQVGDALLEAGVQALIHRRREREEVLFGPAERRFGGFAVAVSLRGGLGHRFEIASQRPRVGGWDQTVARAPAGRRQGYGRAGHRHGGETDEGSHVH